MTFVSEQTLTPINAKAEVKVQNGVPGILCTGIQPGYTDKTIFLPSNNGSEDYFEGSYSTSTEGENSNCVTLGFVGAGSQFHMHFNPKNSTQTANWVRPVLAK